MTPALRIAQLTLREALRRRVLLAAFLLGALFLAVYALGLSNILRSTTEAASRHGPLVAKEARNFFLMAGLYAANFLVVMMSVLVAVDTLSGEILSGTIQAVAAKPLRRRAIVGGKFAGLAVIVSGYLLFTLGGVAAIVYALSGYVTPHLLQGLGLLWLNAILLLALTLLGGAALSTLANGALVFGLYGIAFLGGWIERIGSFTQNQTAILVGTLSSLIMPCEALWSRAAYEMQSPLAAALFLSPFSSPSVPSRFMVVYAGLYAAAALLLALRTFGRRDL